MNVKKALHGALVKELSHPLSRLRRMTSPVRSKSCPLGAALVVLTLTPAGALADEADAINWTAGINWMQDDNVFRLTPNANTQAILGTNSRSDTARITFLGLNVDRTYSRQRFKLDTRVNTVDYERFSFLDYRGGNLTARWDWAFSDRITGYISKYRSRSLSGFADLRSPVQSINTYDNLSFQVNLKVGADWMIGAGRLESTSENSSNQAVTSNTDIDECWLLLRYLRPAGGNITLRAATLEGTNPNRQLVLGQRIDNSYTQDNVSAEVDYPITGQSSVNATLGHSKRTHRELPSRDFSGATGNLGWTWQASGKTALTARVARAIGAQADLLSSYAVTDTMALSPIWTPTAKTQLALSVEQRKRSFQGDPVTALSFVPKREDTTRVASINFSYRPTRAVTLNVALSREQRRSNSSAFYPSTDYDDQTLTLAGQMTF